MVIGGTIIPLNNVEQFNKTMQKYRTEQKMFSALKWSKVTNQKLAEYKRFVEYFFALNNTDNLHFHCIIIDNHHRTKIGTGTVILSCKREKAGTLSEKAKERLR